MGSFPFCEKKILRFLIIMTAFYAFSALNVTTALGDSGDTLVAIGEMVKYGSSNYKNFKGDRKLTLRFDSKDGSEVQGFCHMERIFEFDACLLMGVDIDFKGTFETAIKEGDPEGDGPLWGSFTGTATLRETIAQAKKNDYCDKHIAQLPRSGLKLGKQKPRQTHWSGRLKKDGTLLGNMYDNAGWPNILKAKTAPKATNKTSVSVQMTLEDKLKNGKEDDQLTPADEALLHVSIKNTSRANLEGPLEASLFFKGEFERRLPIQFIADKPKGIFLVKRPGALPPGEAWQFSVPIRVAGERNTWIFYNIIEGKDKKYEDHVKPDKEVSYPLGDVIWVTVSNSDSDANKGLFTEAVPVYRKTTGAMAEISYPDLGDLAGHPACKYEYNRTYYRFGDRETSYTGDRLVRALAIRAARYGANEAATLNEHAGTWDGNLAGSGFGEFRSDDKVWLFPEGDIELIVKNVAHYVHRAFRPKHHPGRVDSSQIYAIEIFNGRFGDFRKKRKSVFATAEEKKVFEKYKKHGGGPRYFPCIANSYMFGSLSRALGIWVREANICYEIPFFGYAYIQDAASEVYYNNEWQFWALYWEEPQRKHSAYLKRIKTATYSYWIGRKQLPGKNVDRWMKFPNHKEISQYWQCKGFYSTNRFAVGDRGLTFSDDGVPAGR